MIQTLVQQPRMTVVSAFAWKVVAELMRRHDHSCTIELLEIHPGSSARGCLRLKLTPHQRDTAGSGIVILNLGGPSGTASIHRTESVEPTEEIDFLGSMLSEDPAACIDRISRVLNLPVPGALPPSSTPALVARLIAEVLGREILSRRMLRTSSAWFDSSMGCRIAAWLKHFGLDPEEQQHNLESRALQWESIQAGVAPCVALHECAPDESNLLDHPIGNAVLLDMNAGRALLVTGQGLIKELDVPLLYRTQGRLLNRLADEIGSHL